MIIVFGDIYVSAKYPPTSIKAYEVAFPTKIVVRAIFLNALPDMLL